MGSNPTAAKNFSENFPKICRGHTDLNHGPIGLQPIALPLSYIPKDGIHWLPMQCISTEHPGGTFVNIPNALLILPTSNWTGVGGIMVSIAAFQAVDPGSIPGRRNFLFSGRM